MRSHQISISFEGEEYIRTSATISIWETSWLLKPLVKTEMEEIGGLREIFKLGAASYEVKMFQWSTFLKTTNLPRFPFLSVGKCVDHFR
jgi:hypothetical protein